MFGCIYIFKKEIFVSFLPCVDLANISEDLLFAPHSARCYWSAGPVGKRPTLSSRVIRVRRVTWELVRKALSTGCRGRRRVPGGNDASNRISRI